MKVKVKKLAHFKGDLPSYATKGAAGMDLRAQLAEHKDTAVIRPGQRALIPTGLSLEIPEGYEVQIRPRSGLALKSGITVLNTPGTIDADYRGEIGVILLNTSDTPFTVNTGDRIAQAVMAPVVQMELVEDELSDTERGEGGFGSSGVK